MLASDESGDYTLELIPVGTGDVTVAAVRAITPIDRVGAERIIYDFRRGEHIPEPEDTYAPVRDFFDNPTSGEPAQLVRSWTVLPSGSAIVDEQIERGEDYRKLGCVTVVDMKNAEIGPSPYPQELERVCQVIISAGKQYWQEMQ